MYIGENQELIVYLKKYNKINVVQKIVERDNENDTLSGFSLKACFMFFKQ